MTTPDVPAERGRDELRERLADAAKFLRRCRGTEPVEFFEEHATACEELAALLAPQEAPAEGISLSAQLSQAAAWMRVWDECQRLGMDTYGAPSTRTGLDIVLDFIRGHAAPQEAREPDIEALAEAVHDAYLATCARLGWDVKPANRVPYAELSEDSKELDRASVRAVLAGLAAARPAPETREPDGWAIRMRDGSWRSTIYEDRETAERMAVKAREFFAARGDEDDEFDSIDVLPVYLGAPAPAEGAGEREQEECVWRAMPTGGWHSACGRNVLLLPVDSLCTCGRSICPDTSEEGAGE